MIPSNSIVLPEKFYCETCKREQKISRKVQLRATRLYCKTCGGTIQPIYEDKSKKAG